ncbi:hypothetical protein CDAR_535571 [Caerostris darwini]|uniref:Uncharacterized protein n=1 Tax=Caerostris darwini TaxID=1538125 RepID=A0AAV4QTB4_9ARAC|nr:hypothetical protein CDAR_535571 [Caerostris darwini]
MWPLFFEHFLNGKVLNPPNQSLTCWNFKKVHWKKFSMLSDEYIAEDLVNENSDLSTCLFLKEYFLQLFTQGTSQKISPLFRINPWVYTQLGTKRDGEQNAPIALTTVSSYTKPKLA